MSKITQEEILHIAELAKIHVDEKECQALTDKLGTILDLIENMKQVKTDHIEPMTHTIFQNQPLRQDIVLDDHQRDYYQKLSQDISNGFYLVPKVIE